MGSFEKRIEKMRSAAEQEHTSRARAEAAARAREQQRIRSLQQEHRQKAEALMPEVLEAIGILRQNAGASKEYCKNERQKRGKSYWSSVMWYPPGREREGFSPPDGWQRSKWEPATQGEWFSTRKRRGMEGWHISLILGQHETAKVWLPQKGEVIVDPSLGTYMPLADYVDRGYAEKYYSKITDPDGHSFSYTFRDCSDKALESFLEQASEHLFHLDQAGYRLSLPGRQT